MPDLLNNLKKKVGRLFRTNWVQEKDRINSTHITIDPGSRVFVIDRCQDTLRYSQILAEKNRLHFIRSFNGERTITEYIETNDISYPNISHHWKQIQKCPFVTWCCTSWERANPIIPILTDVHLCFRLKRGTQAPRRIIVTKSATAILVKGFNNILTIMDLLSVESRLRMLYLMTERITLGEIIEKLPNYNRPLIYHHAKIIRETIAESDPDTGEKLLIYEKGQKRVDDVYHITKKNIVVKLRDRKVKQRIMVEGMVSASS